MELLDFIAFFTVAAAGSAVNSVAGGGTFLVFPVLMLSGIAPVSANILCTIALAPGNFASAYAYRKHRDIPMRKLRELVGISLIGSALGALLLLWLPEDSFRRAVPWLLLFATLLFTFGSRIHLYAASKTTGRLVQFAIAVYGGYFGAGMGIMLLAMLQLLGFTDIHRMNAVKTILTSFITLFTALIFILAGEVLWTVAPTLIAGAVVGGYLGAHGALKVSPRKIRFAVTLIGAAMTGYFFVHGA